MPASCTRCGEQLTYLTEWALERDPTLRVGYFSYLRDRVIRIFLHSRPTAYEALLREVTDDIHSRQPDRFKRFFVQGVSHTRPASRRTSTTDDRPDDGARLDGRLCSATGRRGRT